MAALSWLMNLDFAASAADAPVVVETPQTAAGRRRKKFVVEIDGQEFEAQSVDHAQAILERARELAPEAVERAVRAKIAAKPQIKVVKVAPPQIRTDAPIDLKPIRSQLEQIYRVAAREAVKRIRAEIREDDEEDDLFLLL